MSTIDTIRAEIDQFNRLRDEPQKTRAALGLARRVEMLRREGPSSDVDALARRILFNLYSHGSRFICNTNGPAHEPPRCGVYSWLSPDYVGPNFSTYQSFGTPNLVVDLPPEALAEVPPDIMAKINPRGKTTIGLVSVNYGRLNLREGPGGETKFHGHPEILNVSLHHIDRKNSWLVPRSRFNWNSRINAALFPGFGLKAVQHQGAFPVNRMGPLHVHSHLRHDHECPFSANNHVVYSPDNAFVERNLNDPCFSGWVACEVDGVTHIYWVIGNQGLQNGPLRDHRLNRLLVDPLQDCSNVQEYIERLGTSAEIARDYFARTPFEELPPSIQDRVYYWVWKLKGEPQRDNFGKESFEGRGPNPCTPEECARAIQECGNEFIDQFIRRQIRLLSYLPQPRSDEALRLYEIAETFSRQDNRAAFEHFSHLPEHLQKMVYGAVEFARGRYPHPQAHREALFKGNYPGILDPSGRLYDDRVILELRIQSLLLAASELPPYEAAAPGQAAAAAPLPEPAAAAAPEPATPEPVVEAPAPAPLSERVRKAGRAVAALFAKHRFQEASADIQCAAAAHILGDLTEEERDQFFQTAEGRRAQELYTKYQK